MQINKTISISDALKFGWETFKKRPFFWIVVGIVTGAGGGSVGSSESEGEGLSNPFEQIDPVVLILLSIVILVLALILLYVSSVLQMGAYRAALEALDGKKSRWGILLGDFNNRRKVLGFIWLNFRYGLMVVFGLILLVIPGIYWALKYQFAQYFYLEKNASVKESFDLSAQMTDKIKMQLFGFAVIAFLLMIVGFAIFIVGGLVAAPIVILSHVYIYRKLSLSVPVPEKPASSEPVYQADTVRTA